MCTQEAQPRLAKVKDHSRACHFGTILSLPGANFPRLRRASQYWPQTGVPASESERSVGSDSPWVQASTSSSTTSPRRAVRRSFRYTRPRYMTTHPRYTHDMRSRSCLPRVHLVCPKPAAFREEHSLLHARHGTLGKVDEYFNSRQHHTRGPDGPGDHSHVVRPATATTRPAAARRRRDRTPRRRGTSRRLGTRSVRVLTEREAQGSGRFDCLYTAVQRDGVTR